MAERTITFTAAEIDALRQAIDARKRELMARPGRTPFATEALEAYDKLLDKLTWH